MPRPCKRRRICARPACGRFGPVGQAAGGPAVDMGLDEFETIRLIDLEGMTQEQCAAQMNVARTTVQAIYAAARVKLAQCLVYGGELAIRGGDGAACGADAAARRIEEGLSAGTARMKKTGRTRNMRIAVAFEKGQVFQHFGHTEQFMLYDVEDGKAVSHAALDANGEGHGALAELLKRNRVDTLICGGIGGGARQALADAGIRVYGGVTGEADQAVKALINNELVYDPNARCGHHDHAEGHSCRHGGDHL